MQSARWRISIGAWILVAGMTTSAHADTLSASAGMPSNGGTVCFQFGDNASGFIGVQKLGGTECSFHHWVTPIHWRTFSSASTNRTITVRGKLTSASSSMTCTAFSVNSAGTVVSSSTSSFSTVGSYSSISLTINNVTSTGNSFVSCFMSAGPILMSVSYGG